MIANKLLAAALGRVKPAPVDDAWKAYAQARYAQPAIFGGIRVVVVRQTVATRPRPWLRRLCWRPWVATETVAAPAPMAPNECFRAGETIYVGEEVWRTMQEAVGGQDPKNPVPSRSACNFSIIDPSPTT